MIYLRGKNNASAGGDSIDVTDDFPAEIKSMAVKALEATGLAHGGVDIIYNKDAEDKRALVLELGSAAEIALHVFPLKGTPRDILRILLIIIFLKQKT